MTLSLEMFLVRGTLFHPIQHRRVVVGHLERVRSGMWPRSLLLQRELGNMFHARLDWRMHHLDREVRKVAKISSPAEGAGIVDPFSPIYPEARFEESEAIESAKISSSADMTECHICGSPIGLIESFGGSEFIERTNSSFLSFKHAQP